MSNLGTGAEHMATSYLWRANKRGQRAHIENPKTGRAYCQAENCSDGKAFDGRGAEIPDGRQLCQNCADLEGRDEASYAEPDVRVLMGERIAETEPELFGGGGVEPSDVGRFERASPVAPKPWKRGKQVRGQKTKIARCDNEIGRSKGRQPKRSTVKYDKPFNDDLPW